MGRSTPWCSSGTFSRFVAQAGLLPRFWQMEKSWHGAVQTVAVMAPEWKISWKMFSRSVAQLVLLLLFWQMEPWWHGAIQTTVVTAREFKISSSTSRRQGRKQKVQSISSCSRWSIGTLHHQSERFKNIRTFLQQWWTVQLQQRRVPGCRLVASSWLFNRWAIFSVTYNSSAGWKNPWVQDSELDSIVTRNERRQWFIKLYTRLYTIYQNKCLPWNMYPRDLISLIFWHRSKTGYSSLLDAGSMSDHSLRFSFKISLPLSLYTWYMYKMLGCDWLFHRPNPFPSCDDRWFYPLRWWGNVATRISRWRGTGEWCVLLVLWE